MGDLNGSPGGPCRACSLFKSRLLERQTEGQSRLFCSLPEVVHSVSAVGWGCSKGTGPRLLAGACQCCLARVVSGGSEDWGKAGEKHVWLTPRCKHPPRSELRTWCPETASCSFVAPYESTDRRYEILPHHLMN